jgi:hypothetical protein
MRWPDYHAHYQVLPLLRLPLPVSLALTLVLFMGKISGAGTCQSGMYLLHGINVGTVYAKEFNKWFAGLCHGTRKGINPYFWAR